jgi:nitrile hydratase subunit beta
MNGAHDAGGQMGHGPVVPEANEPVFHAAWEQRMYAVMSATGEIGGWNLDEDRSACEAMPPLQYVSTSYYEHWLQGLETLLQKHGLATAEEIKAGRVRQQGLKRVPLAADAVGPALIARNSYRRNVKHPPRFAVGDGVLARRINPLGHTRLPRYLRGHAGTIIRHHGAHVFPDSNALGQGENPQHLYTVQFKASEVWGATTASTISADLWEPYLEAL